MTATNYEELNEHKGHEVEVVNYVAVECVECGVVLQDYEKPSQTTIRYDEEHIVYRVNKHEDGDMIQIDESENLEELQEEYPNAEVLE